MNIFRKLFSPSSRRNRKSANTLVNDLSFETLDDRIAFDAASLDMPAVEQVSNAVISDVSQPQASIAFPSSPNKTICPITSTTGASDIEEADLSHTNLKSTRSVDAKLTNTDRAFADLAWLSLANTDTTDQDMTESDSNAKDKFATILSEKKEMNTTERKQIERIQAMTEREKERFIKIFFHQAKDTSNQNLYAARGIHNTTEWSPQFLYKRLK